MNYLITGSSKGIGKNIYENLANDYDNFLLLGNNNIKTSKIKNIVKHKLDLNNFKQIIPILNSFIKKFGVFDNIILCAGTAGELNKFGKININNLEKVFRVNFLSNIFILNYLWKYLKSKKTTNIILISSNTVKFIGSEKNFSYFLSKSNLESQALYLAKIGAKYNININLIRPGVVDSNMHLNVKNYSNKDFKDRLSKIPRKQTISKEEISALVEFLCSNISKSISGNIFTISGGE